MNERNKHLLGDILLLVVAIVWGIGFPAVKIALDEGVPTFTQLSLRFAIASAALFIWQSASKTGRMNLRKKSVIKHGLVIGIFLFLGFALQTAALIYTTVSKNAFLTGAYVVFVPMAGWVFFRKKLDAKTIPAAVITFAGIGLLTLGNEISRFNLGDMLTIICALMFSMHITLTSLIANDEPAPTLVFYQMLLASILSAAVAIVIGEKPAFTATGITAVFYLGLFSSMLAFLLQTIGQRYAHASKSAILLSTECLFGALLGILLFNEVMTPRMIIGAVVIFIGIVIIESKPPQPLVKNPLSR